MLIGFGIWCFLDLENYPRPDVPLKLENINKWSSYLFNHGGAYVFTPVGVVVLILGIAFLRRRLVADEEGIGYLGKRKIPWDRVERLDAANLQDKGILDLYYGGGRKLSLDSWKLQGFKELVTIVERHLAAKGRQDAGASEGRDSA
jgi:hypothetical protein